MSAILVRWTFAVVLAAAGNAVASDHARRMFDFTPVSATNPVLARIGDAIVIPVSEYRAYCRAEKQNAIADPASLSEKRAVLNALIDQYLYVDEAYREGVPELPPFAKRMDFTRSLLLADFLAVQAVHRQAKTPEENGELLDALQHRLFEAATIEVSNEACATLRAAAEAVDATSAAAQLGPLIEDSDTTSAKLRSIVERTPNATLARYHDKAITVGQILVIYAGLPPPRPRLATDEALIEMLRSLIVPDLMAREAAACGVEALPEFRNKVIENRNALLRFHAHATIESQANSLLQGPALERRLREWYYAQGDDYGISGKGRETSVPFEEMRARVLGDYSVYLRDRLLEERARQLREKQSIAIDEAVLEAL